MVTYDKYYQNKNLFGDPYPELISFFRNWPIRGRLLDMGCGQGRNAIALARLGYKVTGIDISKVGIFQMNQIAENENLPINGVITDIYKFDEFEDFDFILLDNMFHFLKRDKLKETGFIKRVLEKVKLGTIIVFCVQNTGLKTQILNETIDYKAILKRIYTSDFLHEYLDTQNGHVIKAEYILTAVKV
jgi:2-polyprenyl-3-methyl-5-hydroxy-6-metoxy-1,4-benzoquinol methylase